MVEGYHVVPVVVSDGSEDRTAAGGARGRARSWPSCRSAAAAASRCASGYDIALKLGADIVVTLDADGQHLPEELGGDDRADRARARPTT